MRNFVFAAAMAAMVCVIGCDKFSTTGPQGPQGEKGDRGAPGVGAVEIGTDCKTDAECGNAGKCGPAKFCAWTSSDELTTIVRQRREANVREAEEVLRRADEELTKADEICANTTGDCRVVDEAGRHVKSAEKQIKRAKDQLALVTPAPAAEPSKTGADAKVDDKAGKKDEKLAADKPSSKKAPAAKPPEASAKADAKVDDKAGKKDEKPADVKELTGVVEDLKVDINLLTNRVSDLEGRTEGIEDNQKTLFGKTGELVVAAGELGKKIEAKPPAGRIEPSDARISNPRRFASCVKAREADIFVGEGLTDEQREMKIANDCRAKQAG